MNDSTLTTSTAGLFIEESDDEENQDDDLHHNNNNNNNNNQNRARMSQAMSISEVSQTNENTQQLINNDMDSQYDDIKQDSKEEEDEDDDIDDDEDFPISDVIELLTIAWRNEKLAPEILDYEQEYVERVKQAIDDKEDEIDEIDEELRTNGNTMNNNKIQSASIYWYKKEIERIKYILHSYLRIRLWKIQKYTLHILSDEESYNKLSSNEQKFALAYSDLNERHFKNTFMRDLPSKYQQYGESEMIVKPNLNKFVVIKANENNDNILIENGKHHINLQKNNIFVAKYKSFKHLVAQGVVDLI